MQKKKGISLIVLVISIIVMIILAAAVIVSLSQNGIIGKANEAKEQTNLRQVEQAAMLAWADAYAGGARDVDTLKDAVDEALEDAGVNLDKYEITVTVNGVTVAIKATNTPPVEEPDEEDTTPTQLSTPTISLSGDTLTITDNTVNGSHTASFEIYVGEEKEATMTASSSTTFDLTTLELAAGTYSITVKAVAAEDSTITASEASEAVQYVVAEVSNVPAEWQAYVATVTEDGVPIPKGFVASPYGADETNGIPAENTKAGGLVIYELTDTEITNGATTLPSTETQLTSWTTRNQFVWVPVDKDNFATEFVRNLFNINYATLYGTNLELMNTLGTSPENGLGVWEAELNEYNMPLTTLTTESATFMSADTLLEVQAMYASVKEYGGFYIARYEAGVNDETRTTLLTGLANVHSKMGKIPYDIIPWANSNTMNVDEGGAVQVARSLYTSDTTDASYSKYGVVSTLTYGVQWDRALQWMKEQNSQLDLTNSTSYGNHLDTTIAVGELNSGAQFGVVSNNAFDYEPVTYGEDGNSTLTKTAEQVCALTTGALKKANVNNVYDMAGNMFEWTMEGIDAEYRVIRGGFCDYSGAGSVAIRDVSRPTGSSYGLSFRPSLYIKK